MITDRIALGYRYDPSPTIWDDGTPPPEDTVSKYHPDVAALYERKLVLVRPDGHVAWRADAPPADPLALADRVRGASMS